jgi:hypothetical protein
MLILERLGHQTQVRCDGFLPLDDESGIKVHLGREDFSTVRFTPYLPSDLPDFLKSNDCEV